MKTIKKLTLRKETVASLESNEMGKIKGGSYGYPDSVYCGGGGSAPHNPNTATCVTAVTCPTDYNCPTGYKC